MVTNPPEKPWTLELDCLHHKTFCLLLASISPGIFQNIPHLLTVPEIMQKIFGLFYSRNVSASTKISRDFHSAKHKAGVPLSEHLLALNTTRAKLAQRGEVIADKKYEKHHN